MYIFTYLSCHANITARMDDNRFHSVTLNSDILSAGDVTVPCICV